MSQARRILVVNDGEGVRYALLEILQWLGYEVDAVSSAEEALEAFDEAQHALLITDHCMPGMLGTELIRALRQRCPSLPVIALTGAGEEVERELLAAGADEVLKKPFDIGQIREAVGRGLINKMCYGGIHLTPVTTICSIMGHGGRLPSKD